MIENAAVLAFVCALVLGPLVWRAILDRRRERALAVGADIRHVVDRALGGESLVSVHVDPPLPWRAGRAVLSVPQDWRWLVRLTSVQVLSRLPAGYELVVQQRPDATPRRLVARADERPVAA